MSRTSRDEIRGGFVWNGFDYKLQTWVEDCIIQPVGNRRDLAGQRIDQVAGAERREE